MNLKRLIAFTVVLATMLSCCVVGTPVYADTTEEVEPINCATWDGLLKKSATTSLLQNTYYSRIEDNVEWPANIAALTPLETASNLYCTGGTMTSRYLALAGDGYQVSKNGVGPTGTIRSVSENSERGNYYEVTYSDLKDNVYSNSSATQPTAERPVLIFSYYIRVPEEGKNVEKQQVFRLASTETYNNKNIKARLYVTFTYSATEHNITVTTSQLGIF